MSYDKSESLVVSPLPGQLAGLQYCFSTDSPTHGAPPYRGSTHVLFLNSSPSPHDKEHSPQADHLDQYPSTTKLKHSLCYINQRICEALFYIKQRIHGVLLYINQRIHGVLLYINQRTHGVLLYINQRTHGVLSYINQRIHGVLLYINQRIHGVLF